MNKRYKIKEPKCPFVGDPTKKLGRGKFGAELKEGVLHLPKETAEKFAALGVRESAGIVGMMHANPDAVAQLFGWSAQELKRGIKELCTVLRGHVDDALLEPVKEDRRFPMGALPPPDLAWQVGKTAASIKFVGDAEAYIANTTDEYAQMRLEKAIKFVKAGLLTVNNWLSPQQFLDGDYTDSQGE